MTNEVWVGSVGVTALDHCLVLPPGERAWVDVLVSGAADLDFEAEVRLAVVQYQLRVDQFGSIGRVRDRVPPLERTAQRLEKELTKRRGVRLMTFRPILTDSERR